MNNENMNGNNILLFFQTPNPKLKNHFGENFLIEEKEEFKGYLNHSTAAAQAVNEFLKRSEKEKKLDLVIGICDENKGAQDFKNEIEKNIKEKCDIKTTWIKIKNDDTIKEIFLKISKKYKFKKNDNLFIVTNGGKRNDVFFFSVFIQILSFLEIKVTSIYVELIVLDEQKIDRVIDVSENNKYFNVLRAVELFTETGNPKKLQDIYDGDNSLKSLLISMNKFYEQIQVCRPVNSSSNNSVLKTYNDMITEMNRLNEDGNKSKIDPIMGEMIAEMLNRFIPLKQLKSENKYNFIQILKWCLDNEMIINASFIMDAEITKFLYDNEIVKNTISDFSNLEINECYENKCREYFNKEQEKRKITISDDISDVDNIVKLSFFMNLLVKITSKSYQFYKNKTSKDKWVNKLKFENKNIDIIYIHELVRRTRNSIAHSSDYDIIGGNEFTSLYLITDEYEKKIKDKYGKTETIYNKHHQIELTYKNYKLILEQIMNDLIKVCEEGMK